MLSPSRPDGNGYSAVVTEAVITFLAILAVCAQAALAGAVVLAAGAPFSPRLRRVADGARRALSGAELTLACFVAAVATAGSLYFSEYANFTPCVLCWYQRVAMYPLVPLLALAAFARRPDVAWIVLPLPLIGAAIAVYHYQLEWFPKQDEPFCSQGVPCSVRWFLEFGYISLPLLALTAFLLIALLLTMAARRPAGT